MFSFGRGTGPHLAVAVGPNSACVIRARVVFDPVRSFRVESAKRIPIPRFDDGRRFELLKRRLGEHLEEAVDSRSRRVLLSIPAQRSVVRRITLPTGRRERIDELLRYEAVRLLPFEWDRWATDYQVLRRKENATRLLLAGVRKTRLSSYETVFRELEYMARPVEITPLSLFNLYRFTRPDTPSEPRDTPRAILHLGDRRTDVIVVEGRELLLARTDLQPGSSPRDHDGIGTGDSPVERGGTEETVEREQEPERNFRAPNPEEDNNEKNNWDTDDLIRELQKTFNDLRTGEGPFRVRELLVCGGREVGPRSSAKLEKRLGVEVLPLNPGSRVEGLDSGDASEMLVALGLSLRNSDKAAQLRLDLRSTGGEMSRRSPRLPRYATAGLVGLLLVQIAAAAFLRWTDRRRRLRESRRVWNRLRPAVRRLDQRVEHRNELRDRLARIQRTRRLNERLLSLLGRLHRIPKPLRSGTGIRQFRIESGASRGRMHLRGTTGSYRQLAGLYRWLLGSESVVEILREQQRSRPTAGESGDANLLRFEVTLAVDVAPDTPGRGGVS